MEENWIETRNNSDNGTTIVAVSNMCRIRRKNGTVEYSWYIRHNHKCRWE